MLLSKINQPEPHIFFTKINEFSILQQLWLKEGPGLRPVNRICFTLSANQLCLFFPLIAVSCFYNFIRKKTIEQSNMEGFSFQTVSQGFHHIQSAAGKSIFHQF